MKNLRLAFASLLLVAGLLTLAAPAASAAPDPGAPHVVALKLTGVVDPFVASYVERGLDDAATENADAVLLTIDTPGGLGSSMRKIIQAILASKVPVVCYVAPEGARAASAGTFILISCPVAAMAPGTNVGAAHPVGVSGAIESTKVTNDAVAFIRSLAEQRGRNADWAETAVRDSKSVSAEEALRLDVIDLVSPDRTALLATIDGRTVEVADGKTATLRTAGATVDERTMGLAQSLLHALITPDLAFLFFFAGLILIVVEVLHPGISIPGALGALFLVGAFVSLDLLPVTVVGVALLATSAVSFFVDLKHPGTGVATVIGLVSLILGGLFLFDRSVPNARVSLPMIGAVALLIGLFFAFTVQKVWEARQRPITTGHEALRGSIGVAETKLDPSGRVRAMGESWSADSTGAAIPKGASVRVRAVNRLRLEVEPIDETAPVGASEKGTDT